MTAHVVAACAFILTSTFAFGAPPLPNAERLRQDEARLKHLEKAFASSEQFGDQFWRESKRVADQAGPQIIHALIQRSKKWQGEEGLVFVPLIALLPRKPALEILHHYQRSSQQRSWAHEFLIELEAPDVKEMVRKFSGRS